MKRVAQLMLVLAVTALAASAATIEPVAVRCGSLQGNACHTSGASVTCTWSDGSVGVCECSGDPLKWSCV